jgi:putative protease
MRIAVPQIRFAPIKPIKFKLMQRFMRPALNRLRNAPVFAATGSVAPAGAVEPVVARRPRQAARRSANAPARNHRARTDTSSQAAIELVCQAGSLAGAQAAADNGADCIHLEYTAESERGFLCEAIRYAHANGRKAVVELNTPSHSFTWKERCEVIDSAAAAGVDAIVFSDPALLLYASANHRHIQLHYRLSDCPAPSDSTDLFYQRYGISRVVLPSVLTLPQVERMSSATSVELQVVGFGSPCAILEARRSEDDAGNADPGAGASCVLIGLGQDLEGASVERCAGRENAANDSWYAGGPSPDIDALRLLPRLKNIGVCAIKIEAQRGSPARLAEITRIWRDAIDRSLRGLQHYAVTPA